VDDFNSPDHAAGVLVHKAASIRGAAHEVQCIAGAGVSRVRWQVLEFGEDEQVLLACERTRPRKPTGGHVADGAANANRQGGDREGSHARLTLGERQQRGEHLHGGSLAGTVGAGQAGGLTRVHQES